MNRQYWRPQLHFIYLLYILYSIMHLIPSFWCISIRKPSVLQQQSKRTTSKQIKEHHLGIKKQNHTGTSSEQDCTGTKLVLAPLCSCVALPLAAPGYIQSCLDPVFSGFVFCQFSRPNGFTEGPQNCPSQHNRRSRNPQQQGGTGDSNALHVSQP